MSNYWFVVSWCWKSEKTSSETLRNKTAKSKAISYELKIKLFYFENALSFSIIWSEQKRVDKVFLVKQLKQIWWKPGRGEEGRGEALGGFFLLKPWPIGERNPWIALYTQNAQLMTDATNAYVPVAYLPIRLLRLLAYCRG